MHKQNTQDGNNKIKGYSSEQKSTLFVVMVTAFVTTFTGSALNLSVPDMGADFGVSAGLIGWVVTSYMLAVAAFSVPFGRIADRIGRNGILTWGIFIFAVCSLLAAFAMNIWTMIIARTLQGIGGAMIFSTNNAVLISEFPGKTRGKMLGYSVSATYIGLSLGPVVGGMLNHYFGWHSIMVFTFLVSAVVFLMAKFKLPKVPANKEISDSNDLKNNDLRKTKDSGYDILGNILYIAMIVMIMYGLSAFSTVRFAKYLIPLGIVVMIIFVKHELREESPIVNIRLFKENIGYSFSNLAALLNYGATFAIGYLISIYLQIVMGYTSQVAGFILIAQPVVMAILSPMTGKLSDKKSPFLLASFGMGLCGVGVFMFVFINENYPLCLIFLALIITGFGFAFFSSPNTNAVMACVDKEEYGVATSVLATMRSIGHTSSMAVVTVIVGFYMGNSALSDAEPQTIIAVMRTAFIFFTVMCIAGIFVALKRNRTKK